MNALHSHQDPTGASLPGPLFTPRPGWGGQLNTWLRSHSNTVITTIILITVIALTASILWNRLPARTASYESPRETPVTVSIDVLAIAGQGDGAGWVRARLGETGEQRALREGRAVRRHLAGRTPGRGHRRDRGAGRITPPRPARSAARCRPP